MSNWTGLGSGINRSGDRHQDGGLVGWVVNGPQRQLLQPDDRALRERPAATGTPLQFHGTAHDDDHLVLPFGRVVWACRSGLQAHEASVESVTGHRCKTT